MKDKLQRPLPVDLGDKAYNGWRVAVVPFISTAALPELVDIQDYHNCRKIYLTQPPVIPCVVEAVQEHRQDAAVFEVSSANGVTVGLVLDEMGRRFGEQPPALWGVKLTGCILTTEAEQREVEGAEVWTHSQRSRQ